MSVGLVLLIAFGTAAATGLGALPVMLVRADEKLTIALSAAIAAGFMLGASAALFYEGGRLGTPRMLIGAAFGIGFIGATRSILQGRRDVHVGDLRGARGLAALMVIGVMTIHSFTEGIAVGVSFAGKDSLGILIAIAIAVHNIPEGVAISLALIPYGVSVVRAAGWSVFSSLPQPLMAVPAFLAVSAFEPLLPAGLGFAGGAMVWMVFTQLIPEAWANGARGVTTAAMLSSAAAMVAFELSIGL